MHQPKTGASPLAPDPLHDMPALYRQHTLPAERQRHQERLGQLPPDGAPLVEALTLADGHWLFEFVTLDWEEPGLLDKLFEAILRCHGVAEGVAVRRVRTFTGRSRQVVTLLELTGHQAEPLSAEGAEEVLRNLRAVRPGERGVLETIQHMPASSLIPLVDEVPLIDNERSPEFTCIEMQVPHLSNRFTSVFLHHLARSELWLNIQVALFEQAQEGKRGRYELHVVDKRGGKLADSSVMRLSLVRTLAGINAMLTRYNLQYLRRQWRQRIEGNQHTIYHSRPRFSDYLKDLENVRAMAMLKGFENRLSHLVDEGLLESRAFYFLKKVESFVTANLARNKRMNRETPSDEEVSLCREYFEYRRRALRILMPLFEQLSEMPTRRPLLSDRLRLFALCRPVPQMDYAMDERDRLYNDGPIWLGEPVRALYPFLLLARTECYLREDLLESIEASLEGWNEFYLAEHRGELGRSFLALLDESIRQNDTGIVLRNMRTVGLLQRLIPGFEDIRGRIHINADHAYTVDEHSFVAIDVMQALRLLGEVLPQAGKSAMRQDYERLRDAAGLMNFSRKWAMELRMLDKAILLRVDPAVRPFFRFMEEVRDNRLEYIVEANLLEHGYETCMAALNEIEKTRNQLDGLIRLFKGLTFDDQRLLVLTGLLHDLKKPAVNHDELGGAALPQVLAQMGLNLTERETVRLAWLIRNHLKVRPLIARMATEGEAAVRGFAREAGDPDLARLLFLFTYADRVAVAFERNKNSHDAMVLTEMVTMLDHG